MNPSDIINTNIAVYSAAIQGILANPKGINLTMEEIVKTARKAVRETYDNKPEEIPILT